MNKDYKELVEFLDKKFEKIDTKFDKIEIDIKEFKYEMTEFKNDMLGFKDDMNNFRDKALDDLSTLKQEKTIGDAQDKRKTQILEIHNNALKRNKILSPEESLQIDRLGAF